MNPFSVGTYVIQYSRQAIPRMLGFISLVVVLDSVLTSILLSSIAQLAVLVQGTAHVFPVSLTCTYVNGALADCSIGSLRQLRLIEGSEAFRGATLVFHMVGCLDDQTSCRA